MRLSCVALGAAACSACSGPQSAFLARGAESSGFAALFWTMTLGGLAVFGLVIVCLAVALLGPATWRRHLARDRFIVAGGIVLPVLVLSALLVYGLGVLGASAVPAGEGPPLRVEVVGEQWWWRVRYLHADGSRTETANELRIPVGRRIEIELSTADVIHSFWVPAYAGKVDMIPGRVTTLNLIAEEPGIVRGQCAEYCGGAHALMSFYVVALAPDEFDAWLANERADAREGAGARGRQLFRASGCGGCHTVRGTPARGTIGPDLTHVGARASLGAGLLATSRADFERWVRAHHEIKPGNAMPPFLIFSDDEYRQIADYLASLD